MILANGLTQEATKNAPKRLARTAKRSQRGFDWPVRFQPTIRRKREITAWYQTKNEALGMLSPREYLRGRTWEERTKVGLDALIEHGVLKP